MSTAHKPPDGIPRRQFLKQSAAGAAILAGSEMFGGLVRGQEKEMAPDDLKAKLLTCLGGPWPDPCELRPIVRETIRKEGYRIESVTYEVEPGDRVPAMLLVPDSVDASHPAAAVAVWHPHNRPYHLGKSEPGGLAGGPMHPPGGAPGKEG